VAYSIAITIFISANARKRPGHRRGPAPNGIATRLDDVAEVPVSQRSGMKLPALLK